MKYLKCIEKARVVAIEEAKVAVCMGRKHVSSFQVEPARFLYLFHFKILIGCLTDKLIKNQFIALLLMSVLCIFVILHYVVGICL